MDARAQEKLGSVGWHCCKYVGYIVYGNAENNRGGAKGWLNYGSPASSASEAVVVIVNNGGHVGYVTDGGATVYDAPGANSGKAIRKTNFNTWIKWFQGSTLRK